MGGVAAEVDRAGDERLRVGRLDDHHPAGPSAAAARRARRMWSRARGARRLEEQDAAQRAGLLRGEEHEHVAVLASSPSRGSATIWADCPPPSPRSPRPARSQGTHRARARGGHHARPGQPLRVLALALGAPSPRAAEAVLEAEVIDCLERGGTRRRLSLPQGRPRARHVSGSVPAPPPGTGSRARPAPAAPGGRRHPSTASALRASTRTGSR